MPVVEAVSVATERFKNGTGPELSGGAGRFPATYLRRYAGGVALQVWVKNELSALRRWAFIVVAVRCRFVLYGTALAVDGVVVADVVKLHRNPL